MLKWILTAGLTAWGLAGCAEPISTEVPGPESPLQRLQRERRWLASDALRAAEQYIDQANQALGRINGKTHFKRTRLQRAMVFIEAPSKPGDPPTQAAASHGPAPPADASVIRWSDYVSLAHEISASYGKAEIERIVRTESFSVPYQVVVSCWVTTSYRAGLAMKVQPIPETPEGKALWQPRTAGSSSLGAVGKQSLPLPRLQGQSGYIPDDPLTQQALDNMRAQSLSAAGQEVTFRMDYHAAKGEWLLEELPQVKAFTGLEAIDWYMGLPDEAKKREGILYPGDFDLPASQE